MYRPAYKGKYWDAVEEKQVLLQKIIGLEEELRQYKATRCDFCNKTQSEVKVLLRSPVPADRTIHICNECVDDASVACKEHFAEKEKSDV